jgi:hypothetical protein
MVDDMVLFDVGGQAYRFGSGPFDGQEGQHGFLYFGSVEEPAAREDDADFFHGFSRDGVVERSPVSVKVKSGG